LSSRLFYNKFTILRSTRECDRHAHSNDSIPPARSPIRPILWRPLAVYSGDARKWTSFGGIPVALSRGTEYTTNSLYFHIIVFFCNVIPIRIRRWRCCINNKIIYYYDYLLYVNQRDTFNFFFFYYYFIFQYFKFKRKWVASKRILWLLVKYVHKTMTLKKIGLNKMADCAFEVP